MQRTELVLKAGDIVSAFASNNEIPASELPKLLGDVARELFRLVEPEPQGPWVIPPVPIDQSYTDDYIICLEDGKEVTLLIRYLKRHFNMTFEEYQEKWGLPEDYPTVPKNYSAKRSRIAKDIGLGQKEDLED